MQHSVGSGHPQNTSASLQRAKSPTAMPRERGSDSARSCSCWRRVSSPYLMRRGVVLDLGQRTRKIR
eukprot:6214671-Pleurochrysis_carterae.AAC.5